MANEIQESILKTIDYMVSKRIEKLQLDKTIVCKILYPENAVIGKYMVQYAGGCFSAYAQGNGEVFYEKNSSVYVLVPQNNFSNKKIILGVAASGDRQDYDTSEFSSVLSDYTIVGSNPISNIDEENSTFVLHSDYIAEMLALYKYDQDQSENKIAFNEEAFSTYIKNEEGINALQLEASFQTGLSTEKKDARRGEYGIIVTAAFKNKNNPEEIVYHNYVLDSPNMNGDPFRYTKDFYDQSIISPFDRESYQYIEGIYFYSKGFTEKDNPVAAFWTGGDIRVKDIELNLLKPIDEENGDYSLRLKTPAGTIFQKKDESLTLYGYLYYQRKTDLSTSTEWYWFKKDNSVTASSTDYNVWGGAHWKYFQGANNNKFTITEGNNKSYKTDYMLVAVYNQTIVLRKYFSVYNNTVWYRPQLTSDLGTVFSFDAGRPTITCDFVLSDSAALQKPPKTENDLLTLNNNNYKYIWGIQKGNNEKYTFDLTEEKTLNEIQKLQASIDNSQPGTNVTSLWGQKRDLENYLKILRTVSWGENTFTIETAGINQFATIVCSVYQVIVNEETQEKTEFLVGEADITLTNTISEEVTDYSIYIINGDQVFQYNEYGVTPCSERYADPLQIESLGVKFYSPAGVEINSDNYSVSWRIPQSNTMIATPQEVAGNLKYNPSTQENDILFSEQCDFGIIDSYDYSSLDNQITVTIGYKVDGVLKEYSKDTTFLFTKVGENGTNGTDIVCKIDSSYSDSIGLPHIQKTPFDTKWCDGKKEESLDNCLAFFAYNRNKIIPDSLPVSWKILSTKKGAKQRIGVTKSTREDGRNKAALSIEDNENGYNNLVVQGNTTIDGNSYYANYGVPIVEYTDLSGANDTGYIKPFYVILDKYKTLKSVTYNADGRNPLYNKNQGIFIELKELKDNNEFDNIEDTKYCLCKVSGGSLNSAVTAPMTITSEMETIQNQDTYTQELTYVQEEKESSIEKKDFYSLEEEVSYTYEEVVAEKAEALEALSNFEEVQTQLTRFLSDLYGYLKFHFNDTDFNEKIQEYKEKLKDIDKNNIVIVKIDDNDENEIAGPITEKIIFILNNSTNAANEIQTLIKKVKNGNYNIRIGDTDYQLIEKESDNNDIKTEVREYTYNRLQAYKCENGKLHFYLYPADVYTGEYNNNVVTITIMDTDYNIQAIITIPIYFSLNRYGLASLNAWDGNSLELNEEDGHILAPQIGAGVKNEDNTFTGIVMGKAKTYDQTEKEASVGLLGYSKGEQSIFLDANTGKAVFGLPEGQGENKKFTQGRIELIPNGVSKIGNWSIGSRDLYNITQPLEMRKYGIYTTKTTDENNNVIEQNVGYICKIKWNDNGEENTIEPNSSPENIAKFYNDGFYLMEYSENGPNTDNQYFVEIDEEQVEICLIQDIEWERVKKYFLRLNSNISYREENQYKDDTANKDNANNEDDASKWIIIDKEETDNRGQIGYKQVDMSTYTPYKEYRNAGNSKYFVQDANTTIPFDAQGIVLGANPPYLSVKGMPLTGANSDIDWTNANTSIKEGDSFEVELDPMKSSMFTIYRHYKHKEENEEEEQYRRRPVVGINAMGQFYTNAVEDGDSSMGIGKVGAFGKGAIDEWFVGAQFGLKNSNILKFFIDNPDNLDNPDSSHGNNFDNSSLYITTGSDISSLKNEYARPIKIYGNSITLYGPKTGEFKTELQEGESEEETILEDGKVTNNHFLLGEGNLELEITTEKTGQFYSNKLIIDEEGFKFSSDKDFNLKADKIKITENSESYGLKINSDNNIIDLGNLSYNIAETRTGSNTDSKGRLIINNNSISFGNPYGFYFNSNKDGKTDIIGKGNSETNSLKIGAGPAAFQSYAEFKPANTSNQSSFKITSGTGSLNSQKITINSTTTNNGIYIDGFAKASRYVWNPTKSLDAYMGISASNYTGQLTGINKGDNKKKTNVYETIENALDGLQNRINALWEALRNHQRETSNPHHLKTGSSYLTTGTGLTVKTGSVTIPNSATIPSNTYYNHHDYVSAGTNIGVVTVNGTIYFVKALGSTMVGSIGSNKLSKSVSLGGGSSSTFVTSVTLNQKSSTGITNA